MSRWFRHYAGMMRDDKLVRVALKSKQSVERVVWVWGAILESAAEIDDGGRYELDCAEVSYFLRADEDDIARIEVALRDLGRLHEGHVAKWSARQFQSDKSAGRTARYRERHKGSSDGPREASRDGDVTSQERSSDAPEAETETETELEAPALREQARPSPTSDKGSLLPEDWRLTAERTMAAVLAGIQPDQVPAVFTMFCAHFLQVPGDAAYSRNWDKRWVKWCATEYRQYARAGPPKGSSAASNPPRPGRPNGTPLKNAFENLREGVRRAEQGHEPVLRIAGH